MSNIVPFEQMQAMAAAVAKSGLFGMKTTEQALALMLIAQAEGQHPALATQEYDIIQGKAVRKTHAVLARFQAAGGRVEWHRLDDEAADATFSHPQGGSLRLQWTLEQARKAGLAGKDNWKMYPRAMLRARCIAEGVRAVWPAAIGGLLVSEEAQDLPPASTESLQTARPFGSTRRTTRMVRSMCASNERVIEARPAEVVRPAERIAAKEVAPELYSDEKFAENLPRWRALVESGRKTPDQIIALIESKARLNETQRAAILGLGADAPNSAWAQEYEAAEANDGRA